VRCLEEPVPAAGLPPLCDVAVEVARRDGPEGAYIWPVLSLNDELEHGGGGDGPTGGDRGKDPACQASVCDERDFGNVRRLAR
jgi:hypothetical protein